MLKVDANFQKRYFYKPVIFNLFHAATHFANRFNQTTLFRKISNQAYEIQIQSNQAYEIQSGI